MIGLAAIPGLLVTTKVQNVNKIFAMGGRKFPVVFIATVIPAGSVEIKSLFAISFGPDQS